MFVKTFFRSCYPDETLGKLEGWFRRNAAKLESAEVSMCSSEAGHAVNLVIVVKYTSQDGMELA